MEKLYTVNKIRPGADCGSDHELLNTKFRVKLKKVGKTDRSFRYEMVRQCYLLNVHEFDQTMEDSREQRSWHAAVHGISDDLATEQLEHWILAYKVADSEDKGLPVM